jgi:hypothetical protein
MRYRVHPPSRPRRDEPRKSQNLLAGIMEAIAIPMELVSQNPYHFVNDRLRNGNLNVVVYRHVQKPHAAELKADT